MNLMPRHQWVDQFVMEMSTSFGADLADALARYAMDVWVYRRHQAPTDALGDQRMPMSQMKFWPALQGVDAWLEAQAGVYMAIDTRNAWDDCQEAAHIANLEDRDTIDADPVASIERIYSSLL